MYPSNEKKHLILRLILKILTSNWCCESVKKSKNKTQVFVANERTVLTEVPEAELNHPPAT